MDPRAYWPGPIPGATDCAQLQHKIEELQYEINGAKEEAYRAKEQNEFLQKQVMKLQSDLNAAEGLLADARQIARADDTPKEFKELWLSGYEQWRRQRSFGNSSGDVVRPAPNLSAGGDQEAALLAFTRTC